MHCLTWRTRYFIFQAALIPCICLRNLPLSDQAADWRQQITTTLQTISSLAPVNVTAARCYGVIAELCGRYLDNVPPPFPQASPNMNQSATNNMASISSHMTQHHGHGNIGGGGGGGNINANNGAHGHAHHGSQHRDPYQQHMDEMMLAVDESPQTQMESVYPMMWPNVPAFEAADQFMDDAWMDFLGAEGAADGTPDPSAARAWYGQ